MIVTVSAEKATTDMAHQPNAIWAVQGIPDKTVEATMQTVCILVSKFEESSLWRFFIYIYSAYLFVLRTVYGCRRGLGVPNVEEFDTWSSDTERDTERERQTDRERRR